MAEKIGYKNWLSSARKWVKIVKKVGKKESFVSPDGFGNLEVFTACGYCDEFASCRLCPLFLKKVKGFSVCFRNDSSQTHFMCFLFEMQTEEPKFEIALHYAEVVLNAILEDCPDKDRAVQDRIVFN